MPKKNNSLVLKFNEEQPTECTLKAVIKSPMVGLPPKIAFNHRHTAKIDTGMDVSLPEGYRLRICLVSSLAEKGMVCTNAPGNFHKGRIEVVLLNAGREIVDVSNGDVIAEFWIEQVVDFVWEKQ